MLRVDGGSGLRQDAGMVSGSFLDCVSLLYYLGFGLLAGLTLVIVLRGRYRPASRAPLRHMFCWLALSLLSWQLTLFLEVRMTGTTAQLWLGRANFAAVVFVTTFALRFVQSVPASSARSALSVSLSRWLRIETLFLALLALCTSFVSRTEQVTAGHAVTMYGRGFPLYLLHTLGGLGAALVLTWRHRRQATKPALRRQLTLIGAGMLVTGGIAVVTNVFLPYGLADFRYGDVGTLSVVFFVLAVAYATFLQGLFDLRPLLRETLVYGLLLAFVLGVYSSTVFLVTQYLTTGADKVTQFAVLLIAFSVDPLRRFLEKEVERLLFGTHEDGEAGRSQREPRKRRKP